MKTKMFYCPKDLFFQAIVKGRKCGEMILLHICFILDKIYIISAYKPVVRICTVAQLKEKRCKNVISP
jgi:hypothetical protein